VSLGSEERKNMAHTPKEERHLFRGLRHKLIGTPEEVEKYEKEVAAHLQDDKQDDTFEKATEGLAAPTKKTS
jgi:hypothetical protein